MRGPPTDFWGKLDQDEHGAIRAWHSVADHCADVAAVAEALLERTLLRRRLARLAGRDDLTDVQVARLGVLAALHDVGKFNVGFQNKALWPRPFVAGHMREILALFDDGAGYAESNQLIEALDMASLWPWAEGDIAELLVATISHHGKPQPIGGTIGRELWKPCRGLDPFDGIRDLVKQTRRWFAAAWQEHASPLPADPAFQHGWSGLVMLADWIGSSMTFFPFSEDPAKDRMPFARRRAREIVARLGLDVESSRLGLGAQPPSFAKLSGFSPRATQQQVIELPVHSAGEVTVLEAETGSGKTEAALVRYARLFHAGLVDGLYFALPTRTAATQIHGRVVEAVERVFTDRATRPQVVLAVPGYLRVDEVEGQRLERFEVLWNDDDKERFRYRGWAAENGKRYLAGAVVVGTIDQVLLSALTVSHAHLRATALLRHLLVVDEVHASDTYMNRILEEVLDQHRQAGGHALLMSATLGAAARTRLLAENRADRRQAPPPLSEAVDVPYPLVTRRPFGGAADLHVPAAAETAGKTIRVELAAIIDDPVAVARRALAAARLGARVVVLRNTVGDCLATQEALEAMAEAKHVFHCRGEDGREVMAPHHSRFARPDRELLDCSLEAAFGKQERPTDRGLAAVCTQTVQQSLDLDADLLVTDLCPMDVLLQRIGRLHRHGRESRPAGFETAVVVVLVPVERDLGRLVRPSGEARGPHGFGPVYDDLRVLEATWREIARRETLHIPEDNRALVEATTHPEALEAVVAALGPPWPSHQNQVIGRLYAERRQADLNLVPRDKPFGNLTFPSGDEAKHVPTRLGLADRLVRLPRPVNSPFGTTVDQLTLPHHLVAEGTPADVEAAENVEENAEGFSFTYGPGRYRYDRLGLRPFTPETSPATEDQGP